MEEGGWGTGCCRATAGAAHLHPMTSRIISSDAAAAPSAPADAAVVIQCYLRQARRYEIDYSVLFCHCLFLSVCNCTSGCLCVCLYRALRKNPWMDFDEILGLDFARVD